MKTFAASRACSEALARVRLSSGERGTARESGAGEHAATSV
jgi:hypothetical protein